MSAVGSILTNTGALDALNSISNTSQSTNGLEAQLSSGLSINSPADNPAGYITAQGFTSQLNGITQAISNANQGVSLLQTAQGALQQQIGVTQQLNSIAVQAANGTQTAQESQSLQGVVGQLTAQVSSIASQTQFNNINLLDGTFSNKQFQVGANEGQTLNLSIASTSAASIGLNASTAAASSVFTGTSSATGGEQGVLSLDTAGTASTTAAPAVAAASTGKFTAGTVAWTSNTGTTSSTTVTASESAATIAAAVNATSATTGIYAQATTSITLAATAGTDAANSNTGFAFSIDSGGTAQTINASNTAGLVSQINGGTATTGITAALDKSGNVVLTQSAGNNIDITGITAGKLATTGSAPTILGASTGALSSIAAAQNGTIQGQVQFQSASALTLANGGNIGLSSTSTLSSLANIDVSTTAGANAAITVVKFALQDLGNEGGSLGATQQALTASVNNLNTTSQNVTTALGVVQDANIPQVSNQLTQSSIQAQAGVAALKNSTSLQQSFLSLLP